MEHYYLKSDEVILYEGKVAKIEKYKRESFLDAFATIPTIELLLTNLNIVLTTRTRKMFSKEQVSIEVCPLSEIKFYNDIPQVKQNKNNVELYFSSYEVYLAFQYKVEATKFCNATVKVLTGKSLATRGAEKVKDGIGLVDDTLGINTVDTVKNVLENGVVGTVFSGLKRSKPSVNQTTTQSVSTVKEVSEIARDVIKETHAINSEKKNQLTYDQQVDALNKMKSLLDAGIITQEEFEAKKKQILGL